MRCLAQVTNNGVPFGVNINLTGFGKLTAVPWFNTTRCPQGYYSTKTVSDTHNLCYRCPRNTYVYPINR